MPRATSPVRARELTRAEIDRLAFSARYITCEQVLRFLMDYIDGDRYYKTAYDEHNLVRARAHMSLLCDMERRYDDMCATIDRIARRYRETIIRANDHEYQTTHCRRTAD